MGIASIYCLHETKLKVKMLQLSSYKDVSAIYFAALDLSDVLNATNKTQLEVFWYTQDILKIEL